MTADIPAPIINGFEEKARQVVRRWDLSAYYVKGGCGDECGCDSGVCELAVSAISTALEEAVREETQLRDKYQEDIDSLHMVLNDIGAPFVDGAGNIFSVVGRVQAAIEMADKKARLQEREECAKIADNHEEASREIGFSDAADSAKWLAAAIRSRN